MSKNVTRIIIIKGWILLDTVDSLLSAEMLEIPGKDAEWPWSSTKAGVTKFVVNYKKNYALYRMYDCHFIDKLCMSLALLV